jgi:hypothetical protein
VLFNELSGKFQTHSEQMTTVNDVMESLGSVLMADPNLNQVRISKRRNVVDFHWVPGAGLKDDTDSDDGMQRLKNTSKLFEELKVSTS